MPADGDIAFRSIGAEDKDQVTSFMADFYEEDGREFSAYLAELALDEILAGSGLAKLWLIEQAGLPIGYLCLCAGFALETGGGDYFLDEIYVVEEMRRQGIGHAAMMFVEDTAAKLGARRVCLEAELTMLMPSGFTTNMATEPTVAI